MEKVIRDNKVAILYSPGYGAGWYRWNEEHKEILFHPLLVEMVEKGKRDEITDDWVKEKLNIDIYTGGACDLKIYWLPIGSAFRIEEYDGNETVETIDNTDWIIA